MSTRTPIRFGHIMDTVFADRLSSYQRIFAETTSQHLLYGWRRRLVGDMFGFVLVQGARSAGRVAFELAVSRNETFPYHRLRDYPALGVVGYRETLGFLLKGFDYSEEYHSADGLAKVFREFSRDCEGAMHKLSERAVPRINQAVKIWQPLYSDWLAADRDAVSSPPRRYADLPGETMAYEMLDDMLARGVFDRYLGPLKYRYRQPDFFNCHLYLLARSLEFMEPPPLQNPQPVVMAQPAPGAHPALDDPIAGLTGRYPQEMAVDLAVSTSVRVTEFAFLTSHSAVEAFLQVDAKGQPKAAAEPASLEPDYSFLDDPDYAAPAPVTPPPPSQKVLVDDTDDDDPLADLEARLGLR